jgi:heme exporter protein B
MNSGWLESALTVFRKEWRSEMRSKHGLAVGGLFAVLISVALGFATKNQEPDPMLLAGMLTSGLLFAAVTIIPRIFIAEEEQGTFTLLRAMAEPSAALFGKMLYSTIQMIVTAGVMTALFVELAHVRVADPLFLVLGAFFSALSLATSMSLCGALVLGAANRWLLAGAIGLPLLLPTSVLSTLCLAQGFGSGVVNTSSSIQALVGLAGLTMAFLGLGPLLAPGLWGVEPADNLTQDVAESTEQPSS